MSQNPHFLFLTTHQMYSKNNHQLTISNNFHSAKLDDTEAVQFYTVRKLSSKQHRREEKWFYHCIETLLPPNESRSNLVSFESRNGTCALFSARAFIHLPNALKDKLIDLASSSVCPSLPIKKNEKGKGLKKSIVPDVQFNQCVTQVHKYGRQKIYQTS